MSEPRTRDEILPSWAGDGVAQNTFPWGADSKMTDRNVYEDRGAFWDRFWDRIATWMFQRSVKR